MAMDYRGLFSDLDKSLGEAGLSLRVVCAGGFVLDRHGIRTTRDIDAFFDCSPEVLQIIRDVGDRLKANPEDEPWLNNSIQNMNRSPAGIECEGVYEGANLVVDAVPLLYVAGMKLESGRVQDIVDVASIIKAEGIDSPKEFLDLLEGYGFDGLDEGLVIESFGEAYGLAWLKSYYVEREEALYGGEGNWRGTDTDPRHVEERYRNGSRRNEGQGRKGRRRQRP